MPTNQSVPVTDQESCALAVPTPIVHTEVSHEVDQEGDDASWWSSTRECSCGTFLTAYGADCKRESDALLAQHIAYETAATKVDEPAASTEPPYDDGALWLFGCFLAKEMEFSLIQAQGHPLHWYRNRVGEEICSFSRAAVLRRFTMQACRDREAQMLRERSAARSRFSALPGRIDRGVIVRSPRRMLFRALAALCVVAAGGVWIARFFL